MSPAEYRTIRKKLGLTQAGLASILGETRETVNRRERSESIARRDKFALLWLMYCLEQPYPKPEQ